MFLIGSEQITAQFGQVTGQYTRGDGEKIYQGVYVYEVNGRSYSLTQTREGTPDFTPSVAVTYKLDDPGQSKLLYGASTPVWAVGREILVAFLLYVAFFLVFYRYARRAPRSGKK